MGFIGHSNTLLPATPLIDCDTLAVIRSESLLDHSVTVTAEHCCVVSVCVWVTWSGKVAISLVPTPFFLQSCVKRVWCSIDLSNVSCHMGGERGWGGGRGEGGQEGLLLNLQGPIKLQRRPFDHLLIFLTLTLTPSLNHLISNVNFCWRHTAHCAEKMRQQKGWDRGRWVGSPTGWPAHAGCRGCL